VGQSNGTGGTGGGTCRRVPACCEGLHLLQCSAQHELECSLSMQSGDHDHALMVVLLTPSGNCQWAPRPSRPCSLKTPSRLHGLLLISS
jgi:hypothetical protein